MLSKASIKLNRALCDRARIAAEAAGYSSLEEFIEHAIEKELASLPVAALAQLVPDSFQVPTSYMGANYKLVPLGPGVAGDAEGRAARSDEPARRSG